MTRSASIPLDHFQAVAPALWDSLRRSRASVAHRARVAQWTAQRVLRDEADWRRLAQTTSQFAASGLTDYVFALHDDPHDPDAVFDRLRWGGQFVFIGPSPRQAEEVSRLFNDRRGFVLDEPVGLTHRPRRLMGLPLPLPPARLYSFVARKVCMLRPGEVTDRYSYHLRLVREPAAQQGYVVCKQVPTPEEVTQRLRDRFPDAGPDEIERGVRKLVERVFPVFLTREAAFLRILERSLPERFRPRVPAVLAMDRDPASGLVRRLHVRWLRLGGPTLTQIDFACQAAELLTALHQHARVVHLDLRLDNMVVTEDGVGFVDFGSAVRLGEDIAQSPMLRSLFDEMMQTSQIQRMLGRMKSLGRVTSHILCDSHQKIDPAVDLFYLAVQMNKPLANPEFKGLVRHDPDSQEARKISELTDRVLRPNDPARPEYRSAADLLAGVQSIRRSMDWPTERAGRSVSNFP